MSDDGLLAVAHKTIMETIDEVILGIINEIEEEDGLVGDDVKRRWMENSEKKMLAMLADTLEKPLQDISVIEKNIEDYSKPLREYIKSKHYRGDRLVPLDYVLMQLCFFRKRVFGGKQP